MIFVHDSPQQKQNFLYLIVCQHKIKQNDLHKLYIKKNIEFMFRMQMLFFLYSEEFLYD